MEKRLRRYMEYYRRFAAGEEIVEGDFGEFQKEMYRFLFSSMND